MKKLSIILLLLSFHSLFAQKDTSKPKHFGLIMPHYLIDTPSKPIIVQDTIAAFFVAADTSRLEYMLPIQRIPGYGYLNKMWNLELISGYVVLEEQVYTSQAYRYSFLTGEIKYLGFDSLPVPKRYLIVPGHWFPVPGTKITLSETHGFDGGGGNFPSGRNKSQLLSPGSTEDHGQD